MNKRIFELPDAGDIDIEQRLPVEVVGGIGGTQRQTIGRILAKAQQTAGLKPWVARMYSAGECAIVDGQVKQFTPIGSDGSEYFPEEWLPTGAATADFGYPDYEPETEYVTGNRVTFADRLWKQINVDPCTGINPLSVPDGATYWREVSISTDRFGRDYDAALADDGYEVVGLKGDVFIKSRAGMKSLYLAAFPELDGPAFYSENFETELAAGDWIRVGICSGSNWLIVPMDGLEPSDNSLQLYNTYELAKTMTPRGRPLAEENRITILIAPGYLGEALEVDAPFIDLVSLSSQPDVVFVDGIGINVSSDNLKILGFKTVDAPIQISGNFPNLVLENCIGGPGSFGFGTAASGIFINCEGGLRSFGFEINANGKFYNCKGGNFSFGGGSGGLASGEFYNCIGGDGSFGDDDANGVFHNCEAGSYSFGKFNASGTFLNCKGGDDSFAKTGAVFTGRAYYCIITSSTTFPIVGGSGLTRYCINGDGTPDNQG